MTLGIQIANESCFVKLNAHQSYPLYGSQPHRLIFVGVTIAITCVFVLMNKYLLKSRTKLSLLAYLMPFMLMKDC